MLLKSTEIQLEHVKKTANSDFTLQPTRQVEMFQALSRAHAKTAGCRSYKELGMKFGEKEGRKERERLVRFDDKKASEATLMIVGFG